MEFEPVIGLEVHAQLKTQTKIFCGCSTTFGAPPNTHTCPVCLGMPGVLPVLNRSVVDYSLRMALATHCSIARESRWARKNYFYPDLPKGYQISQYELPIAEGGYVDIEISGVLKRIGINRIHMEEDAGKLIHDSSRPVSRVDLNRAGVPLIEIVSEPDLSSPEEAGAYLRQLRSIVRYLDICDGNMEEGSFRCDANVSIRPRGTAKLGTRTELKNLNSFRHVEKAIHFEIERQREVLLEGGKIVQETRLWDPNTQCTQSMRSKEEAHDYRYFPDPDLLSLVVDENWIEDTRKTLPELPEEKRRRFVDHYGLTFQDAAFLTASRPLADFFEACAALFPNPRQVNNWVTGELMRILNLAGKSIEETPVSPESLVELLRLMEAGVISGKIAKTVFEEMADTGRSASEIVEKKGLTQVTDSSAIQAIVDRVILENPKEAEALRGGKTKLMGFFVGQVMKESRGKANPQMVNELLAKKLKSK